MRLRSGKNTQRTRSASPRLEEASERRAEPTSERSGRSKRNIAEADTESLASKRVRLERSVSSLPETSRIAARRGEAEGETSSALAVEPNVPSQRRAPSMVAGPSQMGEQIIEQPSTSHTTEEPVPGPSQMGEQIIEQPSTSHTTEEPVPGPSQMGEQIVKRPSELSIIMAAVPGPSRESPLVEVPERLVSAAEYVEIPTVHEVTDFLRDSFALKSSYDNIPRMLVPYEAPEEVPIVKSFSEVLGRDVVFRSSLQNTEQVTIFKIRDDASNLFRCIAYLLYGTERMHAVVRRDCMNYILSNRYHFKEFLLMGVEAYVEEKRQLTTYGSHIELRAMAELYNRPITVYYYNQEGDMHLNASVLKKYVVRVPDERQYRNLIDISHPELIKQDAELVLSYHAEAYYNPVVKNEQQRG